MEGLIVAVGWVGSGLVVLSLVQRDVRRLRQVNLAASAVLGVFNVTVGLPSMIALNVVLAAVNGYHLVAEARSAEQTATGREPVRVPGVRPRPVFDRAG